MVSRILSHVANTVNMHNQGDESDHHHHDSAPNPSLHSRPIVPCIFRSPHLTSLTPTWFQSHRNLAPLHVHRCVPVDVQIRRRASARHSGPQSQPVRLGSMGTRVRAPRSSGFNICALCTVLRGGWNYILRPANMWPREGRRGREGVRRSADGVVNCRVVSVFRGGRVIC